MYKLKLMKKLFTLMAVALLALGAAAQTFTPTSAGEMVENGVTVRFDKGSGSTAPTWYTNGLRLYANNTITVSGGTLTNIQLVFTKQGSKTYATLSANSGNLVSGGESSSADDLKTDIWTGSAGSVVFTLGASGQRLIKQIIVNGDTTQVGGGTTGGGSDSTTVNPTLNPNYIYAEPTTIGVPSTLQNAGVQTFVENNILVEITQGAIYQDYFNCYAGQSITFTASKPIKALVVNGYLKKDFTATSSAGNIDYADASEAEVEADPVLIVTDINSASVTLSCVKQIRFYSVDFYFEANPEVEIGNGLGTGLEETTDNEPAATTVVKAMEHGQLIIIRDGIRYNVLGGKQ